jgi:hypothetical protein
VKTAEQFSSPPQDYRVIVPDGWFQVPLDPPDERDRAIVALADLTFRGVDNAPHLKKQLMRDIVADGHDPLVRVMTGRLAREPRWRSAQSKPSRVISTARTVS